MGTSYVVLLVRSQEEPPPSICPLGKRLHGGSATAYNKWAFAVTQRTQEIGIRIALGARPTGVAYEVVSRALSQVAIGVVAGLGVTVVLSQTIYAAQDLRLVAWAGLVIVVTGILACATPTRRAVSIEPAEAFRQVV